MPADRPALPTGLEDFIEGPPHPFTLTDRHRLEIEAIDQRLRPWLHQIERAISAFRGDLDRDAAFVWRASAAGLWDWHGLPFETLGDPAALVKIADAAAALLSAMAELAPWRQMELGELLAQFGDRPIGVHGESSPDLAPDLLPYATIIARLGREAAEMNPKRNAGQPRRYQPLIDTLVTICSAAGAIDAMNPPTGSKGPLGRLFSLCLQAAGIPDDQQPDHGKAIRAALAYIDADEREAQRDFAMWEVRTGKNMPS